jgi:hypothetical protein
MFFSYFFFHLIPKLINYLGQKYMGMRIMLFYIFNVKNRYSGIGPLNNNSKFYLLLFLFGVILFLIPNSITHCIDDPTIKTTTNADSSYPSIAININDAVKYLGGASLVLAAGKATSLVLKTIPANQRLNALGTIGYLTTGAFISSQVNSHYRSLKSRNAIEAVLDRGMTPTRTKLPDDISIDTKISVDDNGFNTKFDKDGITLRKLKDLEIDNSVVSEKVPDVVILENSFANLLNDVYDYIYILGDFTFNSIHNLVSGPGLGTPAYGGVSEIKLSLGINLNSIDNLSCDLLDDYIIIEQSFFNFEPVQNFLDGLSENPFVFLQYYLL